MHTKRGECFVLDLWVVENGSSKETEVHVCAADVGTTDLRLIRTFNRRELPKVGAVGNCTDGRQIN